MNETQNIFVVFYAIFWGTAANAQPRWKAFQLLLTFQFKRVTYRVALSFLLLNVLPILYFGWTIWMLSGSHLAVKSWDIGSIARLVLHSVVPAFATFGFYRMWIGVIELDPDFFYFATDQDVPERFSAVEPSVEFLKIRTGVGPRNILYALLYILAGLVSSQIFR